MKSVTILVSDIADLAGIRVRPVRRTPTRRESLHGRLVLVAGQPGRPSKLVRVRANRPSAPPAKVAAALQRLVPSLDGTGSIHALVLPMGANRVVAIDAAGSRGYLAELECFDEEAGDLLAEPGLYFLEWLHWWSEWAVRDHLKEPVLATTLKALQAIGRVQRWRDTDFRVTECELDH